LLIALEFLGRLQLGAFVLNMLPIPSFDGFGALEPWLPTNFLRAIAPYRQYAPFIVLMLLFTGSGFSEQLWDAIDGLYEALGGRGVLADVGYSLFRFWGGSWQTARDIITQLG
jgi:Zn-dependent protease